MVTHLITRDEGRLRVEKEGKWTKVSDQAQAEPLEKEQSGSKTGLL